MFLSNSQSSIVGIDPHDTVSNINIEIDNWYLSTFIIQAWPDHAIKKEIANLQVACENREVGCHWRGSFKIFLVSNKRFTITQFYCVIYNRST